MQPENIFIISMFPPWNNKIWPSRCTLQESHFFVFVQIFRCVKIFVWFSIPWSNPFPHWPRGIEIIANHNNKFRQGIYLIRIIMCINNWSIKFVRRKFDRYYSPSVTFWTVRTNMYIKFYAFPKALSVFVFFIVCHHCCQGQSTHALW